MTWMCLSLSAVSLVLSLLLCRLSLRYGTRLGLIDRPGSEAHKTDTRIIPTVGGVGMFWAIVLPMLAIIVAVRTLPDDTWRSLTPALASHVPGLRSVTPMGVAILIGLTVMHALGLADDRHRLGAWPKLAVQTAVAVYLAGWHDMRVLQLLDAWGEAGFSLSVAVSVVWIVTITNAMNMLDNMDGLSAGVAAVIALFYLVATMIGGQWFVAAMAALLLGSCVGFLCLNFPPARIYMGDAGSLVLGLMLAIISVRTTYVEIDVSDSLHGWYGVLMPLMLLAVPLYDFTSVTIIRAMAGKSPFVGDTNHFSHRLVRIGLSKRGAVVVIWLATAATGVSGMMLATLEPWQAALAALQTAAVLAMLAILERSAA
jgi:UDP-GlcNAc:undecaprenyl-phosphate GlcNAc-1-phosphate transferase